MNTFVNHNNRIYSVNAEITLTQANKRLNNKKAIAVYNNTRNFTSILDSSMMNSNIAKDQLLTIMKQLTEKFPLDIIKLYVAVDES